MTQGFPVSAIEPGTPLSLVCETNSANPTPVITWWRSSERVLDLTSYTITSEEEDGEFNAQRTKSQISFLATQEDSGLTFECRADGQSQQATFEIKSKLYKQHCGNQTCT